MFSSGRQRKRKIRLRKRDTSGEEDSSSGEDEDSSDGDESMRSPEARAQAEAGTSRRRTAQAAGKTRRIRRRRVVARASATPLPPLPCIAPDGHQTPRRRPARAPGARQPQARSRSWCAQPALESLLLPVSARCEMGRCGVQKKDEEMLRMMMLGSRAVRRHMINLLLGIPGVHFITCK
jgi:hypothetical protein